MLDDLSLKDAYVPPPPPQNPLTELKQLNLDGELLANYEAAKSYLEEIRYDSEVMPNQVAQVMNTINSILKEIVKMQTELYDAERVKKIESAVIATMKGQPKEIQDRFFEEYEGMLN